MIERVGKEIESLHRIFVDWFAGASPPDRRVFDATVVEKMTTDFELIQPTGVRHDRSGICEAIFSAHGSNPALRIAIRNLAVRVAGPTAVVATYEEWQRDSKYPVPDNGRISTVVFTRDQETLRWRHVHETWLPADRIAAGPYDF